MSNQARPNRIQLLREQRGISREDLAETIGCSEKHMRSLELGPTKLTIDWMEKIAAALKIAPAALLSDLPKIDAINEVEPATVDGLPSLSEVLLMRGLRIYKVLRSRVTDAGILAGQTITVDETPEGVAKAKIGDVVLASLIDTDIKLLRIWLPPATLVTSEAGAHNLLVRTDEPNSSIRLIGLVLTP